jgi:hypothetical protein
MFIFWMILPRLIAAAVTSVHDKLSAAEDPQAEARRIGRDITEAIQDTLKEQT